MWWIKIQIREVLNGMGTVNNLKNLKTPHAWGVFDQACYIITNINCAHLSLKLNSLHLKSLLTWTAPSPPWPLHIYICIYEDSSRHFTVCFPPHRSLIAALSATLQHLRRLAAFGFQAQSHCRAAPFIAFVPERACVQRHCVFMLPPLYLKMTHMLKPRVQSRCVFFSVSLYIQPLFYLVCNRLSAVTIATTESIMRSDNVNSRWAI